MVFSKPLLLPTRRAVEIDFEYMLLQHLPFADLLKIREICDQKKFWAFVGRGANNFVVEELQRAGFTGKGADVQQECWRRADAALEDLMKRQRELERLGKPNAIVGAHLVQQDSRDKLYYQFYWPQAAYVRHAEELLKAGSIFGTLAVFTVQ